MNTRIKQLFKFLFFSMLAIPAIASAQVNSGSTGSDGVLDFSSVTTSTNVVIDMHDHPNGVYQYIYVNIPLAVTVTFIPNANNTPVTWLVQSNVVINGTVSVQGQSNGSNLGGAGGPGGGVGGSGGSNPTAGQGPGGGGASVNGGGDGSFGTQGGNFLGATPAYSGPIYGNSFLLPLLGGSGGGGYEGGGAPGGGGGGGGAILIAASASIQLNGSINASGGNGADNTCTAGSGGGIRLVAVSFNGTGVLDANGGSSGSGESGGAGRVRIDAFQDTFGGQIVADPSTISQGFQPIIIPVAGQGIQLNIASIGGVAVSTSPTGQLTTPDAVLSAQQNNPIPVMVNCSNLPLNTAVTVTVKSANGSSVSAIGYNTSGTQTSSTATVSIVIPRGGGLIYATAATGN